MMKDEPETGRCDHEFLISDDSASSRFGVHRGDEAYMVRNVRRGDIYYANLNPVIGSEQEGVRPVLVLSNNLGNYYGSTLIIVPITSKRKLRKLPTHYRLPTIYGLRKQSYLLFEQIRVIDKRRLIRYIGKLNQRDLQEAELSMKIALGISS